MPESAPRVHPLPPLTGRSELRCEAVPGHPDFRPLAGLAGIRVDLRYAGADNFAGEPLLQGLDTAWLRTEAAEGLARAAAWLVQQRPEWRMVVLDALRPQRVQEAIWARVVGTPMQTYFADPVRGSIHSFGMAVDVTLCDTAGRLLDMGSSYDEMSTRSHPVLETRQFALGQIDARALRHRGWLYAAMAEGGFRGIDTEWWHFDHGDRDEIRRRVPRVG